MRTLRIPHGLALVGRTGSGKSPLASFISRAVEPPRGSVFVGGVDVREIDLQLLRTDSKTFADATEARRNRRDAWYVRPAGHIDLCNVPLPVRAPLPR